MNFWTCEDLYSVGLIRKVVYYVHSHIFGIYSSNYLQESWSVLYFREINMFMQLYGLTA